jgi:histone H2A
MDKDQDPSDQKHNTNKSNVKPEREHRAIKSKKRSPIKEEVSGSSSSSSEHGYPGQGHEPPQSKVKTSRSKRAELIFPVSRVAKNLRKGRYAKYIATTAPVYLAGVLEYICAEILESAGTVVKEKKRVRIMPRHVYIGVKLDEELCRLLIMRNKNIIPECGVMEYIHPQITGKYMMPRKQ